jgi:hypothetical protein
VRASSQLQQCLRFVVGPINEKQVNTQDVIRYVSPAPDVVQRSGSRAVEQYQWHVNSTLHSTLICINTFYQLILCL